MKSTQGFLYHIKDEFFHMANDDQLMCNKEGSNYRPTFYALHDQNNHNIIWMIPISSRVHKYQKIYNQKIKRHGKCNTIIIDHFGGAKRAFLIQNAFPIISAFFDHIHTIQGIPVRLHKGLEKKLIKNLRDALVLHKKGIPIIYPDIDKIYNQMETILNSSESMLLEAAYTCE